MTEPLLKLDIDELFDSVHNYEIRLADLNAELVNRNAELANLDAALAERDAELAKYKQLYGELTTII